MFCHQEDYYWNSYSKDNNKNEYVDTEDVEDEINRSIADKLKSIGVNKEEATFYKVDKDIIKYLNN